MRSLCQAHPAAAGFILGFVCAIAVAAVVILVFVDRTARALGEDAED